MRAWSQVRPGDFLSLPLRAHDLLADVPIHDVWRVFLPGEDRRCTMTEVRAAAEVAREPGRVGVLTRGLFALRHALGAAFGWDREIPASPGWSLRARLNEEDRRRTLVAPGTRDGPFSVVYVFEQEALSEIRNSTVQAYLAWAIVPAPGGHHLMWAIYTLPVGPWTGAYLAAIQPFRRFVVYPSLLTGLHRAWVEKA